jgi:hypothetical protein
MTTLKPWLLYIILTWQTTPITPLEQKTFWVGFESVDECRSVAKQIDDQITVAQSMFTLKEIGCYPCASFYSEGCPVIKKKPNR